jgi:putative transcriptional regulator
MLIVPGTILSSSPDLSDPHFEKSVITIAEYNENGALGFVINKPFPRKLNELTEFCNSKPFALYAGGPVDTGNIFVLHRAAGLVSASQYLFGKVHLGGDFTQIITCINKGTINSEDIKLFIGYCGWDAGELEAEIAEGTWKVLEPDEDIIFTPGDLLWQQLPEQ